MQRAVLYESPTKAVVLVDILASLAAPPGRAPRCLHQPLAVPYVLDEPEAQTAFTLELLIAHDRVKVPIHSALEEVKLHHKRPYCHPRALSKDADIYQELDFHANIPLLWSADSVEEPLTVDTDTTFSDISDILSLPIFSTSPNWIHLTLTHPHPPKTFHIPPNSGFLLSRFQSSTATFTALGHFDFLLLDPPWPNRSASRSATYSTLSRFDTRDLLRIPLVHTLLPPQEHNDGGLVGVWITNKPKFRSFVLDVLFPSWGVEMVGEWVWVKITTRGEPMFSLDSAMRKPYESLVFGRKTAGTDEKIKGKLGEDDGPAGELKVIPQKVILAVPDLHSRKPCIKELIEPYLPPAYRACEVFGRNLTEGWMTWGDEALKFNWEGHWKEEEAVGHE